ncbi:Protein FAR1-RELATED SEQUENCE 11 [Bienertia sinuspersici]
MLQMLDFDLNDPVIEGDVNEPFIGQTFESQEEAYLYYKNYAKQHGYVVRKDRSNTKHGKPVRRDFYCHRGGKKPSKVVDMSKTQRNKESFRCHCKAHMRIVLKRCFDIFPEEWHVTKLVKEHNHELLSSEEMHLLAANRSISQEEEKQILLYKEAGLTVRQIIRVMELEKNVRHGELSFIERDVRNLFARLKRALREDDVKSVLQYMQSSKQDNDLLQYAYTVDSGRRLEHLFWCQGQCFELYQKYGDVIVFDTTYKLNAYDMPCAIFVGVDNHGKTILFGCALLRNEKTSTFKWLMKTFVTIMKRPPKTIITDQDPWICWFASLLRTTYQDWCADFYSIYRTIIPEEFECKWDTMVHKYNLQENTHIHGLYNVKRFWAPAYLRDNFFGGMITTGRSESINAFIKKFVSSNVSLTDFVKQVDIAVQEIAQGRLYNNLTTNLRPIPAKSKLPLEEQAFGFQDEFFRASQYSITHDQGNKFIVRYFQGETPTNHNVFWDGVTATCSCKNFEFWGILCRHIFRVFIHKDCFKIPLFYLPLRWYRDALQTTTISQGGVLNSSSSVVQGLTCTVGEGEDIMTEEELMDDEPTDVTTVYLPPKSKTKGRPKKNDVRKVQKSWGRRLNHVPYANNLVTLNLLALTKIIFWASTKWKMELHLLLKKN